MHGIHGVSITLIYSPKSFLISLVFFLSRSGRKHCCIHFQMGWQLYGFGIVSSNRHSRNACSNNGQPQMRKLAVLHILMHSISKMTKCATRCFPWPILAKFLAAHKFILLAELVFEAHRLYQMPRNHINALAWPQNIHNNFQLVDSGSCEQLQFA